MRVVVALGGNALLRRGQALTAENQRANARAACRALAPVACEHELVISHGNGPQVGLLALRGSAYTAVETYPLDVLGAQTEGMIGYILEQELGNELPFGRRLVTVLTMIEVDGDDPAFADPTKRIGPLYTEEEANRLEKEKGWTFKPDGKKGLVVASETPGGQPDARAAGNPGGIPEPCNEDESAPIGTCANPHGIQVRPDLGRMITLEVVQLTQG